MKHPNEKYLDDFLAKTSLIGNNRNFTDSWPHLCAHDLQLAAK